MRKGLYKKANPPDQTLRLIEQNITDAVETLAADHDVISAPVTSYLTSSPVAPGASVVVFRGGPGQVLTLPPANAQGTNTGAGVLFLNASPVAVTVQRSGTDTLAGGKTVSLASKTAVVLMADGISAWLLTSTGAISDGDKGDIIVTGGGTVWTIDPAFTAALLASLEADFVTFGEFDDLERRFRLLLKAYGTTFDIPPGLETEFPFALATD